MIPTRTTLSFWSALALELPLLLLVGFVVFVDNTFFFQFLQYLEDVILAVPFDGLVVHRRSLNGFLEHFQVPIREFSKMYRLQEAAGIFGCVLRDVAYESAMCPKDLIGESGVRIVLLDAESPVPVVSVLWPVYNGSDCPAGLPRAILVEIAW